VVRHSLADAIASPEPAREATPGGLAALVGGDRARQSQAFAAFVADRALHERVRSCTACYLELGQFAVPAPAGTLVHFLSDQQWVLHWLLYVGDDGSEAVVATPVPYGFEGEAPPTLAVGGDADTVVCAESFNEFLYRFWIENEIWFGLRDALPRWRRRRPLTDEQQRYAAHYAQ
jgi:hypothetical protein